MPQSGDMAEPADHTADSTRGRTPAVLLALLIAIVAACGSGNPSPAASASATATGLLAPSSTAGSSGSLAPSGSATPAPSQDLAAIYQTIEDQTVEIRQLQPKRPVQ